MTFQAVPRVTVQKLLGNRNAKTEPFTQGLKMFLDFFRARLPSLAGKPPSLEKELRLKKAREGDGDVILFR